MSEHVGIERVYLYGSLAEQFGKELEIVAESAAKALQIIEANFYGQFYRILREGAYFVWREDGSAITNEEQVLMGTSCKELHIMPAAEGSGGKGGLMTILGVALVGAAVFFSGGLAAGSIGGMFTAMQGTIWGTVAQLGLGLALTGVSMMLAPQLPFEDKEKKQSFLYSGAVNIETEGGPIPVIYGFPVVGSVVISGGIEVEDLPPG